MRDFRDALDVNDVHPGVRDRLDIEQLGPVRNRLAEVVEVVRVDEDRVVSQAAEGCIELRVRAAIERG